MQLRRVGPEFEIGHTYCRGIEQGSDESEQFLLLARVWDSAIYPQLVDRYMGRPSELLNLLKVDADDRPSDYLFKPRGFEFWYH